MGNVRVNFVGVFSCQLLIVDPKMYSNLNFSIQYISIRNRYILIIFIYSYKLVSLNSSLGFLRLIIPSYRLKITMVSFTNLVFSCALLVLEGHTGNEIDCAL